MYRTTSVIVLAATLASAVGAAPAGGATGVDAYAALGVKTSKVLAGTTYTARVVPGSEAKQVVTIVTFLTGRKTRSDAVNVRFGVFNDAGGRLVPVFTQDLGELVGGHVGEGDLQLLDLDQDGTNEILVFFDDFSDPLVQQRQGVVYVWEDGAFRERWRGPVEYDATRDVRNVAEERRDRYVREIDLANTMRTRGLTLFFEKRVIAVAGEMLPQPKIVQETFPLRSRE